MVQKWDKVVIDRTGELNKWVDLFLKTTKRGITVYASANNHYQGHGPATGAQLIKLWRDRGLPDIGKTPAPSKPTVAKQHTLSE